MVMAKIDPSEGEYVDQLFEQNNVSVIDEINRKLLNEIETKKEDLRTMVGERYRDLLKAADTIAEMKNTSALVINHVDNITSSCRILNEKHLIGFKTAENDYQKIINRNIHNNFYGIIIQIKILAGLPELIWTHIDNENYFIATQLFILSRHISTGLQLDSNNEMMKRFPVAKQQWTLLSQFYFTIKQSCIQTLEREDHLTANIVSKCLASLMLLENCQFDKLLTIFIQAKCKTFIQILNEDNVKYEKVKDKILASLNVLDHSTKLIHECFIDSGNGEGLLLTELKRLTDINSLPTISLIQSEDTVMMSTLPDIIAKYKTQITLTTIDIGIVQKGFNVFLQNIENICKTQLKSLINLITSINIIHDIKCNAFSITLGRQTSPSYSFLPKSNFDFFSYFYQNLLNNRITNIINSQWKLILNEINSDVKKLLSTDYPNLKRIIWNEDLDDIPLSLKNALNDNQHEHKLLMKIKGFNSSIVDLCVNTINHNLGVLHQDITLYLDNNSDGIKRKDGNIHNDENNDSIIQYLNECSRTSISELITQIRAQNFNVTSGNCLILGRLFQAIKELTPNLKLCLMSNINNSPNWSVVGDTEPIYDKHPQSSDYWNTVCGLLEEETIRYWRMWLNIYVKEWTSMLLLTQNYDLNTLLNDFPSWDVIKIEEKDEDDKIIESTIRIPLQPSYALQQFLYTVCSNLSNIVPHTIPKQINYELTEILIQTLVKHYKSLTDLKFVQTNQNASLQYFFDLKLITLLFVGRDNKGILDDYLSLLNIYKGFIDPFDFDVFISHINVNLKKCGYRMQNQFGSLIPNMEQLSSALGSFTASGLQDRDPNVLSLSSNAAIVTWFPLLPIVNINNKQQIPPIQSAHASATTSTKSSTSSSNIDKINRKPKAKDKTTASSTASTAQTYAAAFFGMSQEWFRTN